jgi:tryptophan synthase beta subunit
MKPTENILINLSGRGDKDMFTVAKIMGVTMSSM